MEDLYTKDKPKSPEIQIVLVKLVIKFLYKTVVNLFTICMIKAGFLMQFDILSYCSQSVQHAFVQYFIYQWLKLVTFLSMSI